MRALVTGAGGFVGAHLTARLVSEGWDVVATLRPGATPWRLSALGAVGSARVDVVAVDLADPRAVRSAAAGADPDVAFVLGAARAAATPAERAATTAVNATGGAGLVEALGPRCRAVVWVGSSTEYGASAGPMGEDAPVAPRGFFGATKAAGSLLVIAAGAQRGLRVAVLRPFQVYGPLDHPGRLVPAALRAAATGEVLPLTAPGRRRDWIHVDDVVDACLRAAHADGLAPGQVLNLGTGRQVANEELVAMVAAAAGRPVRVAVGAHPGREWDAGSWVCDPARARRLLGWEARIGLEDGLARCHVAAAPRACAGVAPTG